VIGPVVWKRESRFRYRGDHNRVDWARLARLVGRGRRARYWTANARTTVLGERWTLADLGAADRERFLPHRLPAPLAEILGGRHSQVVRLYRGHPLRVTPGRGP